MSSLRAPPGMRSSCPSAPWSLPPFGPITDSLVVVLLLSMLFFLQPVRASPARTHAPAICAARWFIMAVLLLKAALRGDARVRRTDRDVEAALDLSVPYRQIEGPSHVIGVGSRDVHACARAHGPSAAGGCRSAYTD